MFDEYIAKEFESLLRQLAGLINAAFPNGLSRTRVELEQIATGAICFWKYNVIWFNPFSIYSLCGIYTYL